jgi:hypothetical protein
MSSISATAGVQAAQQATVDTQIAVAIAVKQLDAVKSQGDAAVQLIEAAANLSKALGRGHQLDAQG